MAKLSRNALKSIVKECLIEILADGIGSDQINEARVVKKKPRVKKARAPRPALDSITFNNKIENTVNKVTQDPIMASILSDTAKTTLQEHLTSESGAPAIAPTTDVNLDDPTGILGESSKNWADLAFGETKNQ